MIDVAVTTKSFKDVFDFCERVVMLRTDIQVSENSQYITIDMCMSEGISNSVGWHIVWFYVLMSIDGSLEHIVICHPPTPVKFWC